MKKKEVKKYIVIGMLVLVLGILSFVMYQSYAYYKVNYTRNIINAKVSHYGPYDYAYTGAVQTFTVPTNGYYNVELWGAGRYFPVFSLGGYTQGIIYLTKGEKLYVYVGEQGHTRNSNCTLSAWNGGGSTEAVGSYCGFGGSGATDVRLATGSWNNSINLRSRIMVAGGAGGAASTGSLHSSNGGSLIGGKGGTSSAQYDEIVGNGGTQNSGGMIPNQYMPTTTTNGAAGIFGIGGSGGRNALTTTDGGGSSGGGGYYGGSGASGISIGSFGGGGGSSYISGYAGVNSVQQSGGISTQPLSTYNTIHYSGKYFINGKMETGVNNGNGKAKITYVGTAAPVKTNTKLNNIRYIKSCINGNDYASGGHNHWKEIQVIKNGYNILKGSPVTGITPDSGYPLTNATDGDLLTHTGVGNSTNGKQCLLIDFGLTLSVDEIVLWLYFHADESPRTYYENTLSVGTSYVSGTNPLSTILHTYTGTNGYVETSQGRRYTAWD